MNLHIRFFRRVAALCILFMFPVSAWTQTPAVTPFPSPPPDSQVTDNNPHYAPGRAILELNANFPVSASSMWNSHSTFASISPQYGRLDTFFSKYGTVKIRPLFRTESESAGVVSLAALASDAAADIARVKSRFSQRASRGIQEVTVPSLVHIYVVEFDTKANVFDFCREARILPFVTSVTPDFYTSQLSAPYAQSWYSKFWHLPVIKAFDAHAISVGNGVTVAVIDAPIDFSTPVLSGAAWNNTAEIAGNNIDDDKNGYVDDVNGWDYVTSKSPVLNYGAPSGYVTHGTIVGAVLAGRASTAGESIGVSPGVKIMPLTVMRSGDVASSVIAQAIRYAVDNGADVINLSLGNNVTQQVARHLEAAMRYASQLGAVVVQASGNFRRDTTWVSPQNIPGVISVGGSDKLDNLASFANYGSVVDIAAPAVALSIGVPYTTPTYGTSVAAPQVAGAVALLLSAKPSMNLRTIRETLRSTSAPMKDASGEPVSEFGRLNAGAALAFPPVLEVGFSPALSLHNLRKNPSVVITGTATGAGFSSYVLYSRPSSQQTWTQICGPKTIAVQNGPLCTWSPGFLAQGLYVLKLEATSTTGAKFTDYLGAFIESDKVRPIASGLARQQAPRIRGSNVTWVETQEITSPGGLPTFQSYAATLNLDTGVRKRFPMPESQSLFVIPLTATTAAAITDRAVHMLQLQSGAMTSHTTDTCCLPSGFDGLNDTVVWTSNDKYSSISGTQSFGPSGLWRRLTTGKTAYPYITPTQIFFTWYSDSTIIVNRSDRTDTTIQGATNAVKTDKLLAYTVVGEIPGQPYGSREISITNLASGVEQRVLQENMAYLSSFRASGDLLTWARPTTVDQADFGVFLYSQIDKKVQRVSSCPSSQTSSDISNGRVVWEDYRYEDGDIYLYDPQPSPSPSPSPY